MTAPVWADGTSVGPEPASSEPTPCLHQHVYRESPDPGVGLFGWLVECEDCGLDLLTLGSEWDPYEAPEWDELSV